MNILQKDRLNQLSINCIIGESPEGKLLWCLQDAYRQAGKMTPMIRKGNASMMNFARYFKREFGYDSVQYSEYDIENSECRSYLFSDNGGLFYGGANFWQGYTKSGPIWRLQWIWMHPSYRNRKNLKKHWELMTDDLAPLWIDPPVSGSMAFFVLRHPKNIHKDCINALKQLFLETSGSESQP